jgi:hypothetical protein
MGGKRCEVPLSFLYQPAAGPMSERRQILSTLYDPRHLPMSMCTVTTPRILW